MRTLDLRAQRPAVAAKADSAATYCDTLFTESIYTYPDNQLFQKCYDTGRKFIETCPNYSQSWRAFDQLGSAVQNLDNASEKLSFGFQNWLESVLYLNTTDPEYFCACAELLTPPHPEDTTAALIQLQTDRALSLYRWLLQNTTCDTAMLRKEYDQARKGQIFVWKEDSSQGYHYPLDTTLSSLDSIEPGLQELLEKHFLYASVSEKPLSAPAILSNVSASPNPANAGTVISFTMNKEAYVKIEVFDLLGNRVFSAGFESLFEPGNKAVPISLQGLPSGIYFARIVTAYGEVQTVKLVKE